MIDINRKREKETYSKMFTAKPGISEEIPKINVPLNYKTIEDQEYERER